MEFIFGSLNILHPENAVMIEQVLIRLEFGTQKQVILDYKVILISQMFLQVIVQGMQ